jgi:outer membrane protein assembly factor BamB
VVAVGGGATLYVLNGDSTNATGEVLGSVCFDPRADESVRCKGSTQIIEIESSPSIVMVNDHTAHIYVGMDYNEGGPGRAGIVRLTLSKTGTGWTLRPDWKFDVEGLTTYHAGDSTDPNYIFTAGGKGQGCGNTWSSPTVANGLVYFDISNCDTGRYKNEALYGGEAVFAISAESGELSWCYQPRHVNGDDLDFGATPNVLPNGNIGVGGKDGNYYSFPPTKTANPGTGEDACFGAKGQTPSWVTTVSTGGSIDGIIGTPAVGKVAGAGAVFATNAIPMPSADTFTGLPDSAMQLTTLHAIDVQTGAVLWNAPNVFPAYAGPSYTNGVVLMPDTFGMNLTAYEADHGVPLWSFPMEAPSSPPAIVGDSVYVGSGVFPGGDSPAPGLNTVLGPLGFVYAFQVAPTP